MPIRPENRDRYPDDWPDISQRIRFERADGRCECEGECGRGLIGGKPKHAGRCEARHGEPHPRTQSTVILTTAHLDDPIEDCSDENLKAMCQACHLAYDMKRHQAAAAETRARKAEAEQDRRIMQAECMAFAIECATGQRWPRIR